MSDNKVYKFQRFDVYYDGMDAIPDGVWVKYDDVQSALESANAEIAKLKSYKQHFTGATYELTQANFNGLISQLEEVTAKNAEITAENARRIAELDYYKEMELRYEQLLTETSAKQLVNLQA